MLYIFSYSQDENSVLTKDANEVSNLIETVIVNNEVPINYRTKTLENEGITNHLMYMEKIHRDRYKNCQTKFFDVLKTVSLKLKSIDVEYRKVSLQAKLREINRWIINDIRKWDVEHSIDYEVKFHGIVIPLYEGDDSDPLIIVKIVESLARCFNTNKRTPIMIVFETINFSEAKKRRDDLGDIADNVYQKFKKQYSANKQTDENVISKLSKFKWFKV